MSLLHKIRPVCLPSLSGMVSLSIIPIWEYMDYWWRMENQFSSKVRLLYVIGLPCSTGIHMSKSLWATQLIWMGCIKGEKSRLELGRRIKVGMGLVLVWEELLRELESKFHQNKLYEVLKELINVVLNIQCLYWTYTDDLYFHLLNNKPLYSSFITLRAKVIQRLFKIKKDQGIWPRDNAMCVFKHSPTTPVLRILGGAETGRWLWLPESQPQY